jgi:hypothetical protein
MHLPVENPLTSIQISRSFQDDIFVWQKQMLPPSYSEIIYKSENIKNGNPSGC